MIYDARAKSSPGEGSTSPTRAPSPGELAPEGEMVSRNPSSPSGVLEGEQVA